MPYTKPKARNGDKLERLLKGYGLNSVNLGEILDMSHQAAMKRLRDPMLFTLNDLMLVHRRGHIPVDEIVNAIEVS